METSDREAFEALRGDFIRGLPLRVEKLLNPDPKQRDAALHNLAGAAGAFEFDALSELARLVQAAIREGSQPRILDSMNALMAHVASLQSGN